MSIIVDNVVPAIGTRYVSPAFSMSFSIHDDSGAPVNLYAIDIRLNDGYGTVENVLSSGIPEINFSVQITPSVLYGSDGYEFLITPAKLYKNKGMTLSVYVNGVNTGGIVGPYVPWAKAKGTQTWTANPSLSATAWKTATPPGMSNWPFGVDTSADGRYIITNSTGPNPSQIVVSRDYGASWSIYTPSGQSTSYTDCCCSDDGKIMAVCSSGNTGSVRLYVSMDYGQTWVDRASAAGSGGWNGMDCSGDGYTMVLVNKNYNTTYCQTSINAGVSWTTRTIAGGGCGGYTNGCAISGNGSVMAVNAQYRIYYSLNQGVSWTYYALPSGWINDHCVAVDADGSNICAGASDQYYWYLTTNFGSTWTRKSSPINNTYGCAISGDGTKIVLGDYGTNMYLSTNTGDTFVNLNQPTTGNWRDIAMSSDGQTISAIRYVNGLNVYIYGAAFEVWTVGNTMLVSNKDYAIGADMGATMDNVVTAFNAQVGRNVTASKPNPTTILYTANDFGAAGNSIAMTEVLDTESVFFFTGSTLSGGTDETTITTGYPFYTAHHYGRFASQPISRPGFGISATFSQSTSVIGTTMSGRKSNIMFQPNAKVEPVITNRIPVKNSVDNLRTTYIQFSLHDLGLTGVDITSLSVWVNGTQVIQTASFIYPATGTITDAIIDGFEGFTIHINNTVLFAYGSTVTVRVRVKDLISDPMAVNTLDTTYSFRITQYIDNDPPDINPGQPPDGLGLDACIEFDWLDAPFGDGPNFSTLNVTLRRELTVDCITDVRDSIAVIDGAAAPGYTLYATDLFINNQIGYHIIICPDIPFNELEVITVIINGEDVNGNPNDSSFSVSTMETTPPEILHFSPYPGETNVASDALVKFDMQDYGGVGVDVSRLKVKIDGRQAVLNGIAQSGFLFGATADNITDEYNQTFDGYHFSIASAAAFYPHDEILVEIDGYDAYGNYTPYDYSFTITPDTIPPHIEVRPDDGQTGISRDSLINVFITDIVDVNPNSVNISVRGLQAVINGVIQNGFAVTRTSIIDGYRYVIDPQFNFDFNESISVLVSAKDFSDNLASKAISFRTYHDPYAPTISNVTPKDGQYEISLNPPITFTMRDAYDVAFTSIKCYVDGQKAIVNGVVQPDFTGHVSRLSDGYMYTIRPSIDFQYNRTVKFLLSVEDYGEHNKATLDYTWHTISPKPPRFTKVLPTASTNVAVDTNISFNVLTDGYKVDINTLNLYIDGDVAILNKVLQAPDYTGTVTTVVDGYSYIVTVDPRFLLDPNTTHNVTINAKDLLSGNLGTMSVSFDTGAAPAVVPTAYIGTTTGVKSIAVSNIDGYSLASSYIDGYYVNNIYSKTLRYINRIAVSTKNNGTILKATNYSMNAMHYSNGHEIIKTIITNNHNGTLYLLNTTHNRIEVYYNILYDNFGRNIPDGYYAVDGYISDLEVTENTSLLDNQSNSIFIATDNGVYRIETDEVSVVPSYEIYSYGIPNSGKDFGILEGTTNYVVAIDVNERLRTMYVATRSESTGDQNVITYIDLENNIATGSVTEDRLLNRLVNSVSFKD